MGCGECILLGSFRALSAAFSSASRCGRAGVAIIDRPADPKTNSTAHSRVLLRLAARTNRRLGNARSSIENLRSFRSRFRFFGSHSNETQSRAALIEFFFSLAGFFYRPGAVSRCDHHRRTMDTHDLRTSSDVDAYLHSIDCSHRVRQLNSRERERETSDEGKEYISISIA